MPDDDELLGGEGFIMGQKDALRALAAAQPDLRESQLAALALEALQLAGVFLGRLGELPAPWMGYDPFGLESVIGRVRCRISELEAVDQLAMDSLLAKWWEVI